MTLLVVSQCFLLLSRHGFTGEVYVLGNGKRIAIRFGLRQREKAVEEGTLSTSEETFEPVDRLGGRQIYGVQQVQILHRKSAFDMNKGTLDRTKKDRISSRS